MDELKMKPRTKNRASQENAPQPDAGLASERELLRKPGQDLTEEKTSGGLKPTPIGVTRNGALCKILIAILGVAAIIAVLIIGAILLSTQRQEETLDTDTDMRSESLGRDGNFAQMPRTLSTSYPNITSSPPSAASAVTTPPRRLVDVMNFNFNRSLAVRAFTLPSIFDRLSWLPDILLFSGIGWQTFNELFDGIVVAANSSEVERSVLISSQFIILNHPSHYDMICEKTTRHVHLLSYQGQHVNSSFKLVRSRGNIHQLRLAYDLNMRLEVNQVQFLERLMTSDDVGMKQPVCIGNNPAIGKSIFSTHIWRELSNAFPNRNFHLVEAAHFMKRFKELNSTDVVGAVTHILVNELRVNVSTSTSVPIELMFAAFDEALGGNDLYDYENKMNYEILKIIMSSFSTVRLWVTSTKGAFGGTNGVWGKLYSLEETLNVPCYILTEISNEEQINFLVAAWSRSSAEEFNSTKLTHFADASLNALTSLIKITQGDGGIFTADRILLLGFLAEICRDDALEFAKLGRDNTNSSAASPNIKFNSIADFYERLIQQKFKNYLDLNPKLDKEQLEDMHYLLSLEAIFPGKFPEVKATLGRVGLMEVQKVGLLNSPSRVQGVSPFIHESIAEYFVTRFLLKILGNDQDIKPMRTNFLHLLINGTLERQSKDESLYEPWVIENGRETSSGITFASYQFTRRRIAYLLNSDMKYNQPSLVVNESIRDLMEGFISPGEMRQIAYACVDANFIHLFSFLDELGAFQRNASTLFDKNFLFLAIEKTSPEFAQLALTRVVQQIPDFIQVNWNRLLRSAVDRGMLSLVEYLLMEHPSWPEVDKMDGMDWLLYDCVRRSQSDPEIVIDNKITLIGLLVRLDPNLLGISFDSYPSPPFYQDAHPRLRIELIRLGADVLAREESTGETILHRPRLFNAEEYHSFLMSIPEDKLKQLVRLKDKNNRTPLFTLMGSQDPLPSTLDLFREAGADFNFVAEAGHSILASAISNRRSLPTLRKLIACGSSIKWTGWRGETLVHLAGQAGHVDAVNFLAEEHGMEVSSKDTLGNTPLWYTIEKEYMPGDRYGTAMALYKLGQNASTNFINRTDSKGRSLLHTSVINRVALSVSLLLQFGADPNFQDYNLDSPLHLAVRYRRYDDSNVFPITAPLLAQNTNPNLKNENGETPFDLAVYNKNLDFETVQLLKSKTVLDWTPPFATLALVIVMRTGSGAAFPQMVHELEDLGADADYLDEEGNSLLHLAAKHCNLQAVRFIVERNSSELHFANDNGASPLHAAAECKDKGIGLEIIRYMIDKGADVYSKDTYGNNFLHLFISDRYEPSYLQLYSLLNYLVGSNHMSRIDGVFPSIQERFKG